MQGIRVLKPEIFYPVSWRDWRKLFLDVHFHYDVSKSVSLHLWGKHSDAVPLEDVPLKTKLRKLLDRNCPLSMSMKDFYSH